MRATRPAMTSLALLRRRRFAVLFTARTVSVLGNALAPIALAFGILDQPGADARLLAAVLAAQAVPQLALFLVGGVIADRFPRDRVLVVSETTAGLAYGGLAWALLSGNAVPAVLLGCAVLAGVASAMMFPALAGVVPDVVESDDLQSANALLALVSNGSRVAGILVAGALVALVGPGAALAIDAGTYLV
ncbi:MAG TPA: MFS transporter, partial [Actinopolymorphaceae bacterium]